MIEMNEMINEILGKDGRGDPFAGLSLAMAYVPPQSFEEVYDADVAITRGTIFGKLDFPFRGRTVSDQSGE